MRLASGHFHGIFWLDEVRVCALPGRQWQLQLLLGASGWRLVWQLAERSMALGGYALPAVLGITLHV